jgi:hypothetical protein
MFVTKNSVESPSCIKLPFPSQPIRGGVSMRDKDNENGAAKMAWDLFEKTGSISYYMLYYDLIRKK